MRSLADIGERLQRIGALLTERGGFRLGSTEVRPPERCLFIVRFERMPRGELSLKLELMWDEYESGTYRSPDLDLEIGSI